MTEPDAPTLPEHGHDPVLPAETLHYLDPKPGATILDCTLGRGGHSSLIASRLGPEGTLIALDADPRNLAYARDRLAGANCRTHLVHANFAELDRVLDDLGLAQVDGILADLGISTNQLFDPQYGLGFDANHEAALDMRLNPDLPDSAADLLRRWDEKRIADVLYYMAQERYSRRIARKIVEARRLQPISTVGELARLIRSCVPRPKGRGRRGGGAGIDPATRSFMALRMAVNRELDVLQSLLERAPRRLAEGGRFVVISFHSGEDRLVKQAFRNADQPDVPVRLRPLTKKPVTAGEEELAKNPRSRSAKLRAAERVGANETKT